MKQSDLVFKENSKSCVWCSYDGLFDFYWEARSNHVAVSPDNHGKIYVPDNASPALVRKEIVSWLEAHFNV